MSDSSQVALRRLVESTWNTTPAAAMTETRFTGESLAFNVAHIASQEIRSDRQVPDLIQVGADSSGDVNFELSYGEYDDFLESAFYSTFGTAFSHTDTDIDASTTDDSFNAAGADFATTLVAGQWIYVSGFTEAANNGWHKVTAANTASKITVATNLTTEAAGDSVTIKSAILRNGTTEKSFSLEKEFVDKTQFFIYRGMIANAFNLNVAANQIVTGSFGFVGGSAARAGTTFGTGGPNAATTTTPMNGVSNVGSILEGGSPLTGVFIQSVALTMNNNLRPRDAIGTLGHVSIGSGTVDVTGTLNVYFENGDLYDKYLANTESSFSFEAADGAGNRYHFELPRVKYSAGNPQAGAINQDVILGMEFQAIRDATNDYTIQVARSPA